MAKKIFISFDYENDKNYKFLLQAWNAHHKFDLDFVDHSSQEIKSNDVSKVRAALTRRINSADVTLVIVGKEANKWHVDSAEIGYRNWINFEVAKSIEASNSLVAVKIAPSYESPEKLIGSGASLARSFKEELIMKALSNA